MKRYPTKMIITLLIAGLVLAGIGFAAGGKTTLYLDRNAVHVLRDEVKKLLVTDQLSFDQLEVQVSTADVRVIPGDTFRIEAEYNDGLEPNYTLDGNVLKVYDSGTKQRSLRVNILSFSSPDNHVTITLPKGMKLQRASVSSDIGAITLQGIEAARLETRCSTGMIRANDIVCDEWVGNSGIGDTRLENIDAAKRLEITSGTGAIEIKKLNSADVVCKSDIGEVKLTELATGAMDVHSDTGEIIVQGALSGVSKFTTNIGEIDVSTSFPKNTYLIDANSNIGSVDITPKDTVSDTGNIRHQIIARSGTGSVELKFGQ